MDAVISPREAVYAGPSEPLTLFEVMRGSEMLTGELRGNEEQLMLASVFCRRREDWNSPTWMIEPHADSYADDNYAE